ncbi:hypothetical protein GIB67_026317 [Kingdonia uniflora]|uniref:RNase H type-1 domain-containing protein n=1 Tax=Kingdonia uniflora TaxID=39325 RepID=A0A7J7N5I9_9MAGN|nr:hypothetical protein GIB67_026317 [Kingdonia uniflora]
MKRKQFKANKSQAYAFDVIKVSVLKLLLDDVFEQKNKIAKAGESELEKRNILKPRDKAEDIIIHAIGNGRSINLWKQPWHPLGVYYKWLAPPKGVVMLNTNGALTTRNLINFITIHELQGVDNGLKVAIKNGYRKVITGSDSKAVIQLLDKPPWDVRAILQSILISISQLKEFYISMSTGRLIG